MTATSPSVTTEPSRDARHRVLLALSTLLCAAGGTLSAVGAMRADKPLLVVPLVLALGAIAAVVATTRFAVFVMLMLALRASLDVTKLTPGGSDPGTGATSLSSRLITPSTLVVGLFIVAAALWLLAQRRAGTLHPGSGLRRAWAAFAATAFLSLLASADRAVTLIAASQVLAIALMYVVLEELMVEARTRNRMLVAVYVSALGPLLYSVAGFALGEPSGELKDGFFRIAGTFTQSNSFGRYLMLLVLFGIAVLRHVPRRWRTWFAAMITTLTVLLLFTYTLTAIVGTVLGVVTLAVWRGKRLLVVLALAAVCAVIVAPGLTARVGSVTSTPTSYFSNDYHPNSLLWRLSYWGEVLPLVERSPVTGIGLGTTGMLTEQSKQPHNDFLRAFVEEGVVGSLAYLLLLLVMVRVGVRAVRSAAPGSLDHDIGVGYLACAVAFVATSTSDNMFTNVAVLWYLVAFAAAAANVARRDQLEESASLR